MARECVAGLHTMPSSCLLPAVDLWCDGVSCWRRPAAHVPLAWRTGQLWATKGPRGVPRMKWSLRNGRGMKGAGHVFVRGGIRHDQTALGKMIMGSAKFTRYGTWSYMIINMDIFLGCREIWDGRTKSARILWSATSLHCKVHWKPL